MELTQRLGLEERSNELLDMGLQKLAKDQGICSCNHDACVYSMFARATSLFQFYTFFPLRFRFGGLVASTSVLQKWLRHRIAAAGGGRAHGQAAGAAAPSALVQRRRQERLQLECYGFGSSDLFPLFGEINGFFPCPHKVDHLGRGVSIFSTPEVRRGLDVA